MLHPFSRIATLSTPDRQLVHRLVSILVQTPHDRRNSAAPPTDRLPFLGRVGLTGPPSARLLRLAVVLASAVTKSANHDNTGRGWEYVSVHSDTTVSLLAERRALAAGRSTWHHGPLLRAATTGRPLILHNVHKAPPSLLAVLNSLLADGLFRSDAGVTYSCHPDRGDVAIPSTFCVIATAVPCPPYEAGGGLDPPFRSRFPWLWVSPDRADVSLVSDTDTSVPSILVAGATLSALQDAASSDPATAAPGTTKPGREPRPPVLPDAALALLPSLTTEHGLTPRQALSLVYPHGAALLEAPMRASNPTLWQSPSSSDGERHCTPLATVPAVAARLSDALAQLPPWVVRTVPFTEALCRFLLLCAVTEPSLRRGLLVLGAPGSGRRSVVRAAAACLRLPVDVVPLTRETTADSLLQLPSIDGDVTSGFSDGPLLRAAEAGRVFIATEGEATGSPHALAGILGCLAAGEPVSLPDGTVLGRAADGPGDRLVHPDFRLVVVADAARLPLTAELAECFHPVQVEDPTTAADLLALGGVASSADDAEATARAHRLLHLRRLLAPRHRLSAHDLGRAVCYDDPLPFLLRRLLFPFMSRQRRAEVRTAVADAGLGDTDEAVAREGTTSADDDSSLHQSLAGLRAMYAEKTAEEERLVPLADPSFSEIAAHRSVLTPLAADLLAGEPLLLLGTQGVGKNRLVDHLLTTVGAPRQYLSLHPDAQPDTLSARLVVGEGGTSYEDSELLTAAVSGHVLVVDEADKVDHRDVLAHLRAVADGSGISLPDGRRLVPPELVRDEADLPIHPRFRLIVLGNPPFFPFTGSALGHLSDVFSVLVLGAPGDAEQYAQVLRRAEPSLSPDVVDRLADTFFSLRRAYDDGTLTYPYSLREAVAVARVAAASREADGSVPSGVLRHALETVFAPDALSPHRPDILRILASHGWPVRGWLGSVLGDEGPAGVTAASAHGFFGPTSHTPPTPDADKMRDGEVDPTGADHAGGNRFFGGSGGTDTAGLGGLIGPYRFHEHRHPISQVSDAAKDAVPPAVREAQRRLMAEGLAEQLAQSGLDKRRFALYRSVREPIEPFVATLRAAFARAEARALRRGREDEDNSTGDDDAGRPAWVTRRTDGELDPGALVDAVAGDIRVFRRRRDPDDDADPDDGDLEPEDGETKGKPAFLYLDLLVDASASMYRFNGDHRLDRQLQALLLLLEGMEAVTVNGHEADEAGGEEGALRRFVEVAVHGHNGDGEHELLAWGAPIGTKAEQVEVVRQTIVHTQYTWPGDTTEASLASAVRRTADRVAAHADPSTVPRGLVIACSDANFARYGINPAHLAEAMDAEADTVTTHLLLVGSFGRDADEAAAALPAGRGHVVRDTSVLPRTLVRILEDEVIWRASARK